MSSATPLPMHLPTDVLEAQQVPRSWLGRAMLDTVGQTGARVGLVWIGLVAFCAIFAPLIANSQPFVAKLDGQWSSPLLRHLSGVDVLLLLLAVVSAIVLPMRKSMAFPQRIGLILWIMAAVVGFVFWKSVLDWFQYRAKWDAAAAAGGSVSRGMTILFTVMLVLAALSDLAIIVIVPWLVRFPTRAKIVALSVVGVAAVALVIWPVNPPTNVVHDFWRTAAREGRVEWALKPPIPYSPTDRLRDQFQVDRPHPWPPSRDHWLGTEVNGADIASNLVHACRIAMSIGFISTGIALIIGIVVGGLMGYFVGLVDLLGMRLVEIFSAIPTIYLLLTFVAFYGRNIYLIMAIIGLTGWVGDARFVRAEFLKLRKLDFVHAAVAAGLPLRSVLFKHLLPNALAPLLVSASFGVAGAIISESTLSFLGLGLVDEPSWGRLLSQAVGAGGRFVWWLALFPGLVIFLTVLAYNLVGEALRDALDPKLRGGRD